MKIFYFVLFSPDMYYLKMYKITSSYYKRFKFVDTVYYYYDENLDVPIKRNGDFLIIKGKEELNSSITTKTIKAFEYLKPVLFKYDYIIRTNISTIVRFDLMLNLPNITYGGYVLNLQWQDHLGGIYDDKLFGN